MITKNNLIKLIDTLQDSFSIDELIERLVLIEKIEEGLKQSEENDVISEEEMKAEVETWKRILESEKDFDDVNTVTNDELIRKYSAIANS